MKQTKMLAALMTIAIIAFFTAACTDQFTLSGTVSWHDTGGGAEGVSILLFNAADNATMGNETTEDDYTIVTTDASGTYTFTGLAAGSYIVYAALEGYLFDPVTQKVEVTGNTADINFTAYEDDFSVPTDGPYTGSYNDCTNGCLPGNNSCNTCCDNTFDPCFDTCYDSYTDCHEGCRNETNPDKHEKCMNDCDAAYTACRNNCFYDEQKEFDCPDFVPPQECPYNCQVWNPAGRSCVGAAMNACD